MNTMCVSDTANNKKSIPLSLGLFLALFAFYLFTLHPAISPYRDSGDLASAAHTLGIAHPPGYSLYILACNLFDNTIRIGNTAYRINAGSAFWAALTVAVLAYSFGNISIPLLLLFAFSTSFWRLAGVSEMYTMNALLAALIMLSVMESLNSVTIAGAKRYIMLASFLTGFACGNHPTIILLLPGFLFLANKEMKFSGYLLTACFFLAGFSISFFMVFRSIGGPAYEWGKAREFSNFMRIITRADYGGLKLHPEQSVISFQAKSMISNLLLFARALLQQYTIGGFLLGVVGTIFAAKNRLYFFILLGFLLSGPFFFILSNLPANENTTLPILEPHMILPGVLFFYFAAEGFKKLLMKVKFPLLSMLLLPFAAYSLYANFNKCNYRNNYFSFDFGKNIFRTIDPGGMIFNPDDPTCFIASYMQFVENKRPDIRLLAYYRTSWGYELIKRRYPEILPDYAIKSGQELERILIEFNMNKHGIYAELPSKFLRDSVSYPYGLLYKLKADRKPAVAQFPSELYIARGRMLVDGKHDFFTNQIISYYAWSKNNLGLQRYKDGRLNEAKELYMKALAIDPGLEAAMNNLGTLAFVEGNYIDAKYWFDKNIKLNQQDARTYFNLGLVNKKLGDKAGAYACFASAWKLGRNPDAANELGLDEMNNGNYDNAISYFEKIVESNPGYSIARYNLGLAHYNKGDFKTAAMYLNEYMKITADPEEIRSIRALLKTFNSK